MKSDSENAVDVYYLTLPVASSDQARSLANYLNAHGVEAVPDGNDGVTCPVAKDETVSDIRHLQKSWYKFWEHSDAEVFGLSVYVKPARVTCSHESP
jgi:hypothetical protein